MFSILIQNFLLLFYILHRPYEIPQSQKMEQLIRDLEVDDFMGLNPDLFLPQRIQWIGKSSIGSLRHQFSFMRVIQHWAVSEGILQKQLTRFLVLLHTFQPTLSVSDYISLPQDGRTLLKIRPEVRKELSAKVQAVLAHSVPGKPKQEIGNYIHFGLEGAITGKSLGLNHRFHYVNLLRRIHTVFPSLLPTEILEITKPSQEEACINRETWKNWLLREEKIFRSVEPVVFEVKINVDGVQWFVASNTKGTPILAKIVAIRSLSGKTRIKIPYHIAKPFVIGVYEQIKEKPSALQMMADTIGEMKALHPDSLMPGGGREDKSFAVEVRCFNCDDPMRRELKGVKYSGSSSCERCHTKGTYLNKKGVEVKKKPKALNRKQTQVADMSARDKRILKKKSTAPRLANPKAVSKGIKKPPASKKTANGPSAGAKATKGRVCHRGSTYFPEQGCKKRVDESWADYLALATTGLVRNLFWLIIYYFVSNILLI
jgi:hypothetical protein